ncbi:uncharacterized protein BO66DRAFT_474949 [Aspergillus aculeatinus CBS 121060]|uniref:Uncharacterized protein n=1 Tax=Aspergillus aculeatinus CBS 121060 TaxID=1448322 RepID=A0ACD1GW18_9EURO|nr:hypothetical protein BO66DRAFT_474949 [Aspergillus aculeatinus CBS 121060]RAH65544.1 hypothetical protein BO66DRAFT_474949 [Aspergillus aculeatinus CBS 121060]
MYIPTLLPLTLLTLLGATMASPIIAAMEKEKPLAARVNILPNGATCNKDGSMGVCQSNFCMHDDDVDDAVPRYARLHRDKPQALEVRRGQRAIDHLTESTVKAIWTYLRRMGGG